MKQHFFLAIGLSLAAGLSHAAAQTPSESTQERGRVLLKNLQEKRAKRLEQAQSGLKAQDSNTILSNNIVNSTENKKTPGKPLTATGPQRALEAKVLEIKKTPMLSQKLRAANRTWEYASRQKSIKLKTLLNESFLIAQRYHELEPQKQSSSMRKNVEAILGFLEKTSPLDATESKKLAILKKTLLGEELSQEEVILFQEQSFFKEKFPFAENAKNSE